MSSNNRRALYVVSRVSKTEKAVVSTPNIEISPASNTTKLGNEECRCNKHKPHDPPVSQNPTDHENHTLTESIDVFDNRRLTADDDTYTGNDGPTVDYNYAMLILSEEPLLGNSKSNPGNKRLNFNDLKVKNQREKIKGNRSSFEIWLAQNAPLAKISGYTDISLNSVGVFLNGESLDKIKNAPMVLDGWHGEFVRPKMFKNKALNNNSNAKVNLARTNNQNVQIKQTSIPVEEKLAAPDVNAPDLEIIKAKLAWGCNGQSCANLGQGVKIGIIDSGININHPYFFDTGYSYPDATWPKVQPEFESTKHLYTNKKVIAAKVFYDKSKGKGYTPYDAYGHGTDCAGVAAGDSSAITSVKVYDDSYSPYIPSGVAPKAWLGAYNVFPGFVGGEQVYEVSDHIVLRAIEAAYEDGMDLVNTSLGGTPSPQLNTFPGKQTAFSIAYQRFAQSGFVVVRSAGNRGALGYETISSPGIDDNSIVVGGTDVGQSFGWPINYQNTTIAVGSVGGFDPLGPFDDTGNYENPFDKEVVTGKLVLLSTNQVPPATFMELPVGCNDVPNYPVPPANYFTNLDPNYTGKYIGVVRRGTSDPSLNCTYLTKGRVAEMAGCAAFIVINTNYSFELGMGNSTKAETINGTQVARKYFSTLMGLLGQEISIDFTKLACIRDSNYDNMLYEQSSKGPTAVDKLIKPDLVAPGANVLIAMYRDALLNNQGVDWVTRYDGTSLSAPFVAGAVALIKQIKPQWGYNEIRSALLNTSNLDAVKSFNSPPVPGSIIRDAYVVGNGLLDVSAAVNAKLAIYPVSYSFGKIKAKSGQNKSTAIKITNIHTANVTVGHVIITGLSADVSDLFSIPPLGSPVTLAPGESLNLVLRLSVSKLYPAAMYTAHAKIFSSPLDTTPLAHFAVAVVLE